MTDDDMLAAMRNSLTVTKDALTGVHLDRPPEAITARARARRLRRSLTGAAAATLGLALGLVLTLPGGQASTRPVHVNLDAWSVNSTAHGTVDVTIRDLSHPEELRQALAEAHVPAVVRFGELCTASAAAVIRAQAVMARSQNRNGDVVFEIHPAAIPPGAEFLLSIEKVRVISPDHGAAFVVLSSVVPERSHLICHVTAASR
jgi:hypothetical protein